MTELCGQGQRTTEAMKFLLQQEAIQTKAAEARAKRKEEPLGWDEEWEEEV